MANAADSHSGGGLANKDTLTRYSRDENKKSGKVAWTLPLDAFRDLTASTMNGRKRIKSVTGRRWLTGCGLLTSRGLLHHLKTGDGNTGDFHARVLLPVTGVFA